MRESINLLWLKRPCYDLTLRQRFHAETEPLLWLKAECNDLTLPLVLVNNVQIVLDRLKLNDAEQLSTQKVSAFVKSGNDWYDFDMMCFC